MHADRVGDGAQIERSQMLDAWARKASCSRTISEATFKIVRWRCSRLFSSQLAFCMQVEMKLLSASPFAWALTFAA